MPRTLVAAAWTAAVRQADLAIVMSAPSRSKMRTLGAFPPRPVIWGLDDGGEVGYLDIGDAVVIVSGGIEPLRRALLDAVTDDDWRQARAEFTARLQDFIGLLSLRQLGPLIGRLRLRHNLNILGMEALAVAVHIEAEVHLSASSPRLEEALRAERREVVILT